MSAVSTASLSDGVMIPDLLRAEPRARAVLDKYGLRGCGGPSGPHESLGYFARAHGVPPGQLLDELRATLAAPPGRPAPEPGVVPADAIYRPFFKTAIAVVLTLGATWGAYLLVRIAIAGKFTAVGIHEVNAHGHAQIFGWVGLFVMGFAYQAFPRFKHTTLAHPRLAFASFWLMAVGLVARSVLEPLAVVVPALVWPTIATAVVEVAAVGLFVYVIAATWRTAGQPLTVSDAYIVSALVWFFIQTVYEGVYLAATFLTPPEGLVALVATWQAPLRDLQIHGFALLMILGVSQRMLHPMFGLRAPARRVGIACLVGLNAAVVGESTGLVLMRLAGREWAGLWYLSVLLLAGCVVALAVNWRVFGRAAETDRGLKFLRAAYAWLLVSLAMLVALPAYQFVLLPAFAPDSHAAQIGFSHAYYGATRHAITVGFVSLMIVGVASKIVPTLNGVDPRSLTGLWGPFVLINVGCALRVAGQTATDFADWVFPLAGVSGTLEVTGLALWGVHLWRVMNGAYIDPRFVHREAAGRPIARGDTVVSVLDRHPELLPVFLEYGFRPLASPVLRRTAARGVTIGMACRLVGADEERFVAALNANRSAPPVVSLPVVNAVTVARSPD
ncbi:MAG TPA: DUF1858 domain-containing protein [Fimbriiglobus sp.]|jgi:hypothetical protein|nr:DUF1858 domain-containing protein [Fimbriiglobus sp.]